jgi:trigger factor
MEITVTKVDEINSIISGSVNNEQVEAHVERIAVDLGKQIKVDGFRKGKVPPHVVKKMHGEKLIQDAEQEALKEFVDAGMKEAGLTSADIIGQPGFKKFERAEKSLEIEIEISKKPEVNIEGYKEAIPSFEKPKPTEEEIQTKLDEVASGNAPFEAIKEQRALQNGDMAVIDFEGFVDGEAFEGGKAEKFNLQIGSGQFIPGFEEQLIGMKSGEEKSISVTFPVEYQAANLAGKDAEFKVKLHEVQEQLEAKADDALAQKVLQDENATLQTLKEKLKEQIQTEKIRELYGKELKPQILTALVEKIDFVLPLNIVQQEIDAKVNAKAGEMSQEELKEIQENIDKLEELRESVREEAEESVKATFIVDAIAKEEGVDVEDQEVQQTLYYEAMMTGQDPQQIITYYQENNLLPAVKMGMIEDKLFSKLLGLEK